jgi:hypothetical protein
MPRHVLRFTCTSYHSKSYRVTAWYNTPVGNSCLWHIPELEWLVLQFLPSRFPDFQFRVLPNIESDSSSDFLGAFHWGWVVPDTSVPSQFCQEVGEENIPCDILVFLSIGIFEVVVWCVTSYQLLSYLITAVLATDRVGHTFPSAVGVGITLGKLCSIYETGFGEVQTGVSSGIYLSFNIAVWLPEPLERKARKGRKLRTRGRREGREADSLSLNSL